MIFNRKEAQKQIMHSQILQHITLDTELQIQIDETNVIPSYYWLKKIAMYKWKF